MKRYYNLGKNFLFPICRSITGNGTRKTLKIIKNEFPSLKIKKFDQVQKYLIGKYRNGILKMLIL